MTERTETVKTFCLQLYPKGVASGNMLPTNVRTPCSPELRITGIARSTADHVGSHKLPGSGA